MSLSTLLEDYASANNEGKQDMYEEAAERMITAEKAVRHLAEKVIQRNDAVAHRIDTLEAVLRAVSRNLARSRTVGQDRDRLVMEAEDLARAVLDPKP